MDFQEFINQKVINKKQEEGIVVSFDKEHIVVQYEEVTKNYNPDVALKNGFLSFVDSNLQGKIKQYYVLQTEEEEKDKELKSKTAKVATRRNKDVIEKHKRLVRKAWYLQGFFGPDFIYPPLEEFEKKYNKLLIKRTYSVVNLHSAINDRFS